MILKIFYFIPKILFDFFKKNINDTDLEAYQKSRFIIVLILIFMFLFFNVDIMCNQTNSSKLLNKFIGVLIICMMAFLLKYIFPLKKIKSIEFTRIDYRSCIVIYSLPIIYVFLKVLYFMVRLTIK